MKTFDSSQDKIEYSKELIRCWYEAWDGKVCVSFSGGKDSTVLMHLARSVHPDIIGLFSNTGLEYPEVVAHVKSFDNIIMVRPKKNFKWVLENKGYPVISKKVARGISDLQNSHEGNQDTCNLRITGYNKKGVYCPSFKLPKKWLKLADAPFKISDSCCNYIKKEPMKRIHKELGLHPITGQMISEGGQREFALKNQQCNAYELKSPISNPMSYWDEQDVLEYIIKYDIKIPSVYGDIVKDENGNLITTGEKRTGCMFCMFGVHLEKGENRFERMKRTHPQQYDFIINKLNAKEVLDYLNIKY